MSTTFDVIPGTRVDVTTGELLRAAETSIHAYFDEFDITARISLSARLIADDNTREFGDHDVLAWSHPRDYLWITIDGLRGGTDVYCSPIERSDWDEEGRHPLYDFLECPAYRSEYDAILEGAVILNRRWYLRRSAGQPAAINLAYGLIASSLAELTGGLIMSNDSAWDYAIFPLPGAEFAKVYLRPGSAKGDNTRDWSNRCIEWMREELKDS